MRDLEYAELQVTTNFSFLRGASHAEELVAQAKALGLAALAITDRNTLAGVVRAHTAAKEVGLRLLVGARLDLEDAPSLLCLPVDRRAYGRLSRLLSLGQRRAAKGECVLRLADVAAHAEGQIFIAVPPEGWDWREALTADKPEAGAEIIGFPGRRSPSPLSPEASLRLDVGEGRGGGEPGTPGVLTPAIPEAPAAVALSTTLGRRRGQAPDPSSPGGGGLARTPSPLVGEGRGGGDPRTPAVVDLTAKGAPVVVVPPTPNPSPPGGGGFGSACPNVSSPGEGERPQTFASQLRRVKSALGAARLYLAAHHSYRGDDRARLAALAELARRCGTPLVATGDVLYHAAHRRPLADVLACVREGTTVAAAGLRLEANAERHLKPPREMARLFRDHAEALARTLEIAAACRFSLDELVYEYPDEPVPPGRTPQAHLEELARDGARWRFPDGVPAHVAATLARELAIVAELGYAPYFLTVHDIVSFAKSRGILCQGRGSAANSVVCYCLGITAVNPTEVDLLFERFVSHARKEPPDIDVDFEHERREEVIQYIYARYGRDRAGLTATVISYRARSAVRDVGKAMGLSEDTVAALAGMVWGTHSEGGAVPEAHVRGAGLDPGDPRLRLVLELTQELIGFPRHLSQHVGGFVLTRGALVEVVPVGNAAMEDRTFIEWDKDDIAALGLLKVDVLALGMLTCIRRAFDFLAAAGTPVSLATVPREDPGVYDMLCRADSIGVFQVESRAQMNMLPRLKPRTFYDLVIEVAIVRPGPIQGDMVHPYLRRRDGLEPEDYPAPDPAHGPPDELRQILGKTKGVPLFQEQAMRIAMVAAKFSETEVNELRKAMATFRRRGTIGLLEEKMVNAMVARGYDPEFAARCFNQIKGFGEYGFPESHAASFAHLVYVSAWLKCHHPAAFCAAILNSQPMGFYAPAQLVRDAREHGVEVRPADAMLSDWDATLERGEEEAGAAPSPVSPEASPRPEAGEGRGGGESRTPAVVGSVASPTLVEIPLTPNPSPRGGGGLRPAVRLGLRQIDGLQEEEVKKIVAARQSLVPPRGGVPAASLRGGLVHDLWRRAGVKLATLEKLAAADAFRSLGLDRRQALWEVKALAAAAPLPLFDWTAARETGAEPEVALPRMPLCEHVVNDYQTLRLSLKAHPMSFLRARLAAARVLACHELRALRDGAFVRVAGVVLVRQRPGSAKGVVFVTIEDETGIANAVVWPKTLERFRKVVLGARLILIEGRIQRHEDIIHIIANRLEDRSDWLSLLSEWAADMRIPVANADEVRRPDPGSAREPEPGSARSPLHPRWARAKPDHPRHERIIPKSRDFH